MEPENALEQHLPLWQFAAVDLGLRVNWPVMKGVGSPPHDSRRGGNGLQQLARPSGATLRVEGDPRCLLKHVESHDALPLYPPGFSGGEPQRPATRHLP